MKVRNCYVMVVAVNKYLSASVSVHTVGVNTELKNYITDCTWNTAQHSHTGRATATTTYICIRKQQAHRCHC